MRANIEGLIRRNVDNFLFDRQIRRDPIGYAVFDNLESAVADIATSGKASVAGIEENRLRSASIVRLGAASATSIPCDFERLRKAVADAAEWGDALAGLVTTSERGREWMIGFLNRMAANDMGCFRVSDQVAAVASRARDDWAAKHAVPAGELGYEGQDESQRLVRLVWPDEETDTTDVLKLLKRAVPKRIAKEQQARVAANAQPIAPRVAGLAVHGEQKTGFVFPLQPTVTDGRWNIDSQLPFSPDDVLDVLVELLKAGRADAQGVPERLAFRFENRTRLTARGESMTVAAALAALDCLTGYTQPLLKAAVVLVKMASDGALEAVGEVPAKLKAANRECGELSLLVCPPGTPINTLARALAIGRQQGWEELFGQSEALQRQLGDSENLARTTHDRIHALLRHGDLVRAAQVLDETDRSAQSTNVPWLPFLRADLARREHRVWSDGALDERLAIGEKPYSAWLYLQATARQGPRTEPDAVARLEQAITLLHHESGGIQGNVCHLIAAMLELAIAARSADTVRWAAAIAKIEQFLATADELRQYYGPTTEALSAAPDVAAAERLLNLVPYL